MLLSCDPSDLRKLQQRNKYSPPLCLCAFVPVEDERREVGQTIDQIRKVPDCPLSSGRPGDRARIENLVSSLYIYSRPLSPSSRFHDHVLRFRFCHRWQGPDTCSLSHVQGRGSRSSPGYKIACKKEACLIHPPPKECLHHLSYDVFQVELNAPQGARSREPPRSASHHRPQSAQQGCR